MRSESDTEVDVTVGLFEKKSLTFCRVVRQTGRYHSYQSVTMTSERTLKHVDCSKLGCMTEPSHGYRLWLPVVWMRLNQYNVGICSLVYKVYRGLPRRFDPAWYRIPIDVEERGRNAWSIIA